MSRPTKTLVVIALVSFGVWLYFENTSPKARIARPYARKFGKLLQTDGRFTNVTVFVKGLGSKGPLYVSGRVRSEADEADLRRSFDALGCPVGVSWQVQVDTNLTKEVK